MKKRILMLTLVLMIVLSSFSVASAASYYINSFHSEFGLELDATNSRSWNIYDNKGNYLAGDWVNFPPGGTIIYKGFMPTGFYKNTYSPDFTFSKYMIKYPDYHTLTTADLPLLITDTQKFTSWEDSDKTDPFYQDGEWINSPDIITVKIKPAQRILFNYTADNKDKFLKSISATPQKSITLHQGYYINNQVIDLVIKKDTTDLLLGQNALDLSDFPVHRPLNQNEYLGYTQANSGNWIWYPGSNGDPVSTDKNSLVTFVLDRRYCSYKVVSANTGLVLEQGGQLPEIPDDGIYSGPGNITDNYLLDRGDFEEGLIGDIKFGFENLFQFIRMPFELLYKFILTLGDVITYALGTVAGFTTALQGIYAILPGPIWFLVIMAISINVFKLIFGR